MHGVVNVVLGGKVYDMSEEDDVIEVNIDIEDVGAIEEVLVGAFEGRIIIGVKVVKAEDIIAATLKGKED